jgi:hypothetical protein
MNFGSLNLKFFVYTHPLSEKVKLSLPVEIKLKLIDDFFRSYTSLDETVCPILKK